MRPKGTGDQVADAGIVILPTPDPRPDGVTYVTPCVLPEGNEANIDTGVTDCESGDEIGGDFDNPDPLGPTDQDV